MVAASCSMKVNLLLVLACSRLARRPTIRLSRPVTVWPRDRRRSHRWLPMKPAAPVTKQCFELVNASLSKSKVDSGENCKNYSYRIAFAS